MGCYDRQCCQEFREEFKLKSFNLTTEAGSDFTKTLWFQTKIPLFIYRVIAFIFTTIVWFMRVIGQPYNSAGNFVLSFFTVWSFTILTLYFAFGIVSSVMDFHRNRKSDQYIQGRIDTSKEDIEMNGNINESCDRGESNLTQQDRVKWYHKVQWFLYNITTVCGILVTLIYWAALYPQLRKTKPGFTVTFTNASSHAVNSVLILIEIVLTSVPTRLLHVFHCIAFLLLYIFMNSIYWACGFVVYPKFIDWNYPQTTGIAMVGTLIFAVVGQFVMFGTHKLKIWIFNKYINRDQSKGASDSPIEGPSESTVDR